MSTISLVAVVQIVAAWPLFFSFVQGFDDEGYMAMMYREWIERGSLYDEVYSQYGPFHTLVFGLPFKVLGLSFTLTAGRVITLLVFVASAATVAVVVRKLTNSLLAGVLGQVLVFLTMWGVVTLPMHPVTVLVLLMSLLLANVAVLRPHVPVVSDWVTGGIVAAVLLTKVNVGVFVVVALTYTIVASRDRSARRWLLPVTELAFVALGPVLLLSQRSAIASAELNVFSSRDIHVIDYWSVAYVAAAVVVVVFTRRARAGPGWTGEVVDPIGVAGGFTVVGVTTIVLALVTGTGLTSLFDAVVIRPLGQSDALTILPTMTSETLVAVAIVVPLLIVAGWAATSPSAGRSTIVVSGGLRIVAGLVLLVATVPALQDALGVSVFAGPFASLPIVALAVLPRAGSPSPRVIARILLASVAVAQTLHAFPVAGVQQAAAMLFPLVCAVIILDDGVRELAFGFADQRWAARGVVPSAILVAVLLWAGWVSGDQVRGWVDRYHASMALDLPGSRWMRADAVSRHQLREVLDQVSGCRALVTYPGSPSLDIWSDIPPVTGYNATIWTKLLRDDEQQRVVDQLEQTEGRVCYLLRTGAPSAPAVNGGPLERYVMGFRPVWSNGSYQLFVRPEVES